MKPDDGAEKEVQTVSALEADILLYAHFLLGAVIFCGPVAYVVIFL